MGCLQTEKTIRVYHAGASKQYWVAEWGKVLMVTLVPSNGGVRVYVGGFDPAPSNVMTVPDWRISACVGAALTELKVAKIAAAAMVRSFIVVEGCTRRVIFDPLNLDV